MGRGRFCPGEGGEVRPGYGELLPGDMWQPADMMMGFVSTSQLCSSSAVRLQHSVQASAI